MRIKSLISRIFLLILAMLVAACGRNVPMPAGTPTGETSTALDSSGIPSSGGTLSTAPNVALLPSLLSPPLPPTPTQNLLPQPIPRAAADSRAALIEQARLVIRQLYENL